MLTTRETLMLIVIIGQIQMGVSYNFEPDKLIMRGYFRPSDVVRGRNSRKVSLKSRFLKNNKGNNVKNALFREHTDNYDNGGERFSGDFSNVFGPESFYFQDFSDRQKRDTSEKSNQIELSTEVNIQKTRRSLFGELTELPRSRNFSSVKPSKVKLFGVDPYNKIVTRPKYKEKNTIKLNRSETRSNYEKEINEPIFHLRKLNNTNPMYQQTTRSSVSNQSIYVQAEVSAPYMTQRVVPLRRNITGGQNTSSNNETRAGVWNNNASHKVINWQNHSLNANAYIDKNNKHMKQYVQMLQLNPANLFRRPIFNTTGTVSEVALLKVLEILTKTLRKIMRQHEEMKKMHREVIYASKDFINNREDVINKLKLFDKKHHYLINKSNSLAALQLNLASKQEILIKKENAFLTKHRQFEQLQHQFSKQQHQFYKLQQIVANNNFRIQVRQGQIAKKQQDISDKQNALWSILQKEKTYLESKTYSESYESPRLSFDHKNESLRAEIKEKIYETIKDDDLSERSETATTLRSVSSSPIPIESYKVILNESDLNDIDDLVYKMYFKNKTIDRLINHYGKVHKGKCGCSKDKHMKSNSDNESKEKSRLEPLETTTEQVNVEIKNKPGLQIKIEFNDNVTAKRNSSRIISREAELKDTNIQNDVINDPNNILHSEDQQIHPRNKRSVEHSGKKLKGGKLRPHKHLRSRHARYFTRKGKPKDTFGVNNVKNYTVDKVSERSANVNNKWNTIHNIDSRPYLQAYQIFKKNPEPTKATPTDTTTIKSDIDNGFLKKAKQYCYKTGHHRIEADFDRCVIKAVIKMKSKDPILTTKPAKASSTKIPKLEFTALKKEENLHTSKPSNTNQTKNIDNKDTHTTPINSTSSKSSTRSPYFPDNDELEAKVADYERSGKLSEGTVFWDGSMHASNYVPSELDNDGASDLMPGDDSGELLDPVALELQAKKRAYVRRLNEQILKTAMRKH